MGRILGNLGPSHHAYTMMSYLYQGFKTFFCVENIFGVSTVDGELASCSFAVKLAEFREKRDVLISPSTIVSEGVIHTHQLSLHEPLLK